MFDKILIRFRIEPLGVAMPGPHLPLRLRKIFDRAVAPRISRVRVACLSAACLAVSAAFTGTVLTGAQSISGAPDWEKAVGGKMSFDVASVKQNFAPFGPDTVHSNIQLDGDSFTPTGGLLSFAP